MIIRHLKNHSSLQLAIAICRHATNWLLLFPLMLIYTGFAQSTTSKEEENLLQKFQSAKTGNGHYFLIKKDPSQNFADAGLNIVRTLSANIVVIKGRPANAELRARTIITEANNLWKLSPQLLEVYATVNEKERSYIVSAFNILQLQIDVIEKKLPIKILRIFEHHQSAIISCKSNFLITHLLADENIIFADAFTAATAEQMVIGYDRTLQHINRLQQEWPEVNGKGTTIGIKEQKMDDDDLDLLKRVQPSTLAAANIEEHASIVATLAGGAGNSFYTGKGVAWQCNFYPSSFANLFPDDAQVLTQNNVWVQNHSYGTLIQNFYGAEANAYDAQTFKNKNLVHVFASGNKGQEAATQGVYSGLNGFGNLTGNFKMAKNVISVAATDTSGNIAGFSSAGPLYDGRLGPQIAALGPSGTSDAAALVSGAVALLQQVYKDSNSQALPPASLVKTILYTTADDIDNPGIDYRSGFGALNIFNAVKLLRQKKYDGGTISQGQTWTKNISLPSQVGQLKVTLCWTDTASAINNFKSLVNDVDLQIVEQSSGTIYQPWCLNQAASTDSLNQLPRRRRDSLNTVEQVTIALPAAGNYQIKIIGREIIGGTAQPFHIAYSWDTLGTFKFTSPVNASDADRNEDANLAIKWESVEADTNKMGQLWVSYNNGTSWKIIAAIVKLSAKKYAWPLPDTASRVKFRMDNGTGSFYSNEFILAPLTKVSVGFLCADSLQLFWNKHIYASSYKIFTLIDSAYLKQIATVTDTTFTLPRSGNGSQIFAVQPVTNVGLFASRSAAIDVTKQGVNCFYKTLLAEDRISQVALILELSTTAKVDSIVFEKLDRNGQVMRMIGKVAVNNSLMIYSMADLLPLAGTNYYRATILLKNGTRIVTETVLVLSTGNKVLFLYPNPAIAGQPIGFQLSNFSPGLTLQITDVIGRLLKTQAIGAAGKIDTRNIVPGLYFVTIFEDGKRLETGKLLIKN